MLISMFIISGSFLRLVVSLDSSFSQLSMPATSRYSYAGKKQRKKKERKNSKRTYTLSQIPIYNTVFIILQIVNSCDSDHTRDSPS